MAKPPHSKRLWIAIALAAVVPAAGCAWPATVRVENNSSETVKVLLMTRPHAAVCVLYDWAHLMDHARPLDPGRTMTLRSFEPFADASVAIGGGPIRAEFGPFNYRIVSLPRGRTRVAVTGDQRSAELLVSGAGAELYEARVADERRARERSRPAAPGDR